MSREEFMERLAFLLSDIPQEEREDALSYYEDYFAEAGEEKEAEILKELGSPERVAAMIRSSSTLEDGGSFTERGFEDERFREPNYQLAKRLDLPEVSESQPNTEEEKDFKQGQRTARGRRFTQSQKSTEEVREEESRKQPWTNRGLKIFLWIVLFAVAFDLLETVFEFSRGVAIVLGSVLLFAGAGVIGCFVLALVCFWIAAINLLTPFTAVFFAGIGLMSLGAMFLFLVLTIQIYGKWLPALAKRIWNFFQKAGRNHKAEGGSL